MIKGFTLIELLTTLAISSIVLFFSGGFYGEFLQRQKVTSDINRITSIISSARNHAISQRQNVDICGFVDQQCSNQWYKIQVTNENNEMIYQDTLVADYSHVVWSAFQRKPNLEFRPNGFTNHQNGTLYLCHKKFSSLNRAIVISKSGRVSIDKNTNALDERCK